MDQRRAAEEREAKLIASEQDAADSSIASQDTKKEKALKKRRDRARKESQREEEETRKELASANKSIEKQERDRQESVQRRRQIQRARASAEGGQAEVVSSTVTTSPGGKKSTSTKYRVDESGIASGGRKTTSTIDDGTGRVTETTQNVQSLIEKQALEAIRLRARRTNKAAIESELEASEANLRKKRVSSQVFTEADSILQDDRDRRSAEIRKSRSLYRVNSATASKEGFSVQEDKTGKDGYTVFARTQRKGLLDYEHQTIKVSRSTGEMTRSIKSGGAAIKSMGDNFIGSIEKVGKWGAAVSIIMAAKETILSLYTKIADTETSEILLARVGKNIGNGKAGKRAAARDITESVIEKSTVIGGDVSRSLRAGSVFARAGQSKEDVIRSTTTAMLASKVAELELVESAELLSATYLQFNLAAGKTPEILDRANQLSNNYRVTTDDIFQSISRAGGVISDMNGRYTELAAVTAVASQVTARSGPEIGNAIKTIASNLERVDTRTLILKRLGVQTEDLSGKSKSYTQVLFELELASRNLSGTEKNQIGIQIAGVRQRNQLIAQMKEIVNIVIAENELLFSDQNNSKGSAVEELRMNYDSLQSTLERTGAEMFKVAESGSGPLKELAKDVLYLVNGLLALTSAGGGIAPKLVVTIGVVLAMSKAIAFLRLETTRAAIATSYKAATDLVMASSSAIAAASTGNLTGAVIALKAALSSNIFVAIASVAAIGLLISAGRESNAVTETSILLQKKEADAKRELISLEIDRANAVDATTDKITKLLHAEKEARESGTNEGKSEAERLRSQAERLARSANIKLDPNASNDIYVQEAVLRQQAARKKISSLDESKSANESEIGRIARSQIDIKSNVISARKKASGIELNKKVSEDERGLSDDLFLTARGVGAGIATSAQLDKKVEAYSKTIQGKKLSIDVKKKIEEFVELERESRKVRDAIDKEAAAREEAVEKLKRANSQYVAANVGLTKNLNKLNSAEFESNFSDKFSSATRSKFDAGTIRDGSSALERQKGLLSEIFSQIQKLEAAGDIVPVDMIKQAVDLEEKLLLIEQGRLSIIHDIAKSQQTSFNRDRFSLQEAASSSKDKIAESNRSVAGESAISPIAEAKRRENALKSQASQLRLNLSEVNNLPGKDEAEIAEKGGRMKSLQEALSEKLNSLADSQIEKARALYEVEASIAEERKKSADEAARALGTLSDEDKLRVAAQAAYFKSNPGKEITAEQQFFMNSRDVQIGRQFFGGRFQDAMTPPGPGSALSKSFEGSDFGTTYQNKAAQARAELERGGRTDQEINRLAEREAADLRAAATKNSRGFAINPNDSREANAGGVYDKNGAAKQTLSISPQFFDTKPMVDAFVKVLEQHTANQISAMEQRLSTLLIRQKQQAHLPATIPGN